MMKLPNEVANSVALSPTRRVCFVFSSTLRATLIADFIPMYIVKLPRKMANSVALFPTSCFVLLKHLTCNSCY